MSGSCHNYIDKRSLKRGVCQRSFYLISLSQFVTPLFSVSPAIILVSRAACPQKISWGNFFQVLQNLFFMKLAPNRCQPAESLRRNFPTLHRSSHQMTHWVIPFTGGNFVRRTSQTRLHAGNPASTQGGNPCVFSLFFLLLNSPQVFHWQILYVSFLIFEFCFTSNSRQFFASSFPNHGHFFSRCSYTDMLNATALLP